MNRSIQLVALLAVAGCASQRAASDPGAQHAAQSAPAGHAMHGGMGGMCAAEVPDTHVAVSDTPDGGAITFTTSAANVDEVRRRAHAMADMHNQHHGAAADAPPGGQHGMMAGMMPPPSHAVAEDVDGGARISVTPDAPADLDKLRSTMRMHAEHMQGGHCGMMGGQM